MMETGSKLISEVFCVMNLSEKDVYYEGGDSEAAKVAMNNSSELWLINQHLKYVERNGKLSFEIEESYWNRDDVDGDFSLVSKNHVQTGRIGAEHIASFLNGSDQTS